MHPLSTIGYEGSTQEDFLTALQSAGIKTLLDIRDVPWSRKPGFSQKPLRAMLEQNGIRYIHLKGLGNPRPKKGEPARSLSHFEKHLNSDIAKADLTRAAEHARQSPSCLLCFERDPNHCHRNLVAPRIAALTGQDIHHLFPEKPAPLFDTL